MTKSDKSQSGIAKGNVSVRSQAERHAAAIADPDCKPIQPEDLPLMPRVPRVRFIRRRLGLSQEQFAEQFHIPIGTLRDWEQARKEPDAAAKAYLRVIAREPEMVRRALEASPAPEPVPEPAK